MTDDERLMIIGIILAVAFTLVISIRYSWG